MRKIGGYGILGLLGRGGMGAVYKARLDDGPIVALKLLAPSEMLAAIAGEDELERRFMAEARTMHQLNHPNVAPGLDIGRDGDGRPFFTMEYFCDNVGALIGETYNVEDPSRVLRIDRAVDIARQTLIGLAALHGEGIIHRDIKPFNLLLTPDRTVRIIDFGLSKLRGERMRLHGAEQVGSPYYAAPEQEADPEGVDERADLFAVGVMLYRMLTGHLPTIAMQPASTFNTDLNGTWDAFFEAATHKRYEKRYASARAMLDALNACMAEWEAHIDAVCRLPEDAPDVEHLTLPWDAPLRSQSIRTGPKAGPERFALDSLWRPEVFCDNAFTEHSDVVRDAATGLLWQKGASPEGMDWYAAHEYVQHLNAERFGGHSEWRLPTADELLSLVRPVAKGRDFCAASLFSSAARRLWTADRRSYISAWYVDMELGFLWRHDFTCRNHVRVVCSV